MIILIRARAFLCQCFRWFILKKGETTSLKRHGRCSIKNSVARILDHAVQGMEECVPTLYIILIWASKDAMLLDGQKYSCSPNTNSLFFSRLKLTLHPQYRQYWYWSRNLDNIFCKSCKTKHEMLISSLQNSHFISMWLVTAFRWCNMNEQACHYQATISIYV